MEGALFLYIPQKLPVLQKALDKCTKPYYNRANVRYRTKGVMLYA